MIENTMVCPNPECPDLDATGARGEYVVGTERCPYCGTALVAASAMEPGGGRSAIGGDEAASTDLEPIFSSEDPAEIQIVRSILRGADIPHQTTHDSATDRVLPGFDPFRFMRGSRDAVFWVPADRAEEARALLTEIEPGEDPDSSKD